MSETRLVNLTRHPVKLVDASGNSLTIAPNAEVARVQIEREHLTTLTVSNCQIPVFRSRWGRTKHLPEPSEGVLFIVSSIVADASPERTDLVVPDAPIYAENGEIVGMRGLRINHKKEVYSA